MSYTFCDGISKLIPNKPGKPVTIQYPPPDLKPDDKEKYAIAAEPMLAERIEREEDVRNLIEMAQTTCPKMPSSAQSGHHSSIVNLMHA